MNSDKKSLMRRLQAADFAVYETILYLDGHPNNRAALEYFQRAKGERDLLMKQYSELYGPVTADQVSSATEWSWVNDPWPWQIQDERRAK